jgi:trimeric autotransporter adhesin
MAGRNALPDLKARLRLDISDADKAASQARSLGKTLGDSIGQGAVGADKAGESVTRLRGTLGTVEQQQRRTSAASADLAANLSASAGSADGLSGRVAALSSSSGQAAGGLQDLQHAVADTTLASSDATDALEATDLSTVKAATSADQATTSYENLAQSQAGVHSKTVQLTTVQQPHVTALRATATAQRQAAVETERIGIQMGKAVSQTLSASAAFNSLAKSINSVPQAQALAGRLPGGLGSAALGGGGPAVLAGGTAAAGLVVNAAIIKTTTDAYVGLADQIRELAAATGVENREAAQLLASFDNQGVSAETTNLALYTLTRNIQDNSKAFDDNGVAVAHNVDGSIDLTGTLVNINQRMNELSTGSEKASLAQALFGRQGRELLPILTQDEAAFRAFIASGADFADMTDQDIQSARQFQLTMGTLDSQISRTERAVGRQMVPALTEFARNTATVVEWINAWIARNQELYKDLLSLAGIVGMVSLASRLLGGNHDKAAGSTKALGAANVESKGALDAFNTSLEKQASDLQAVYDKQNAQIDLHARIARAELEVSAINDRLSESHLRAVDAAQSVTDAQEALNTTIRWYGANSPQARAAQEDLTKAQLAANDAARGQTQAVQEAVAKVSDLARLAGEAAGQEATWANATQRANIQHDAQVTKLRELEARFPALTAEIEGMITALGGLTDKTVHIHVVSDYSRGFLADDSGAPSTGRAAGGPALPNRIYTVGETAPETLIMGASGGWIVPHGGDRSASPAAASTTIIEIDSPIVLDDREVGRFMKRVVAREGRGQA